MVQQTSESLRYKTILADPPWNETGAGRIKRGADKHYSLMKTADIIAYMKEIPLDPSGSHLYLWVTNNFLPDGLEVMKALGFRYVTNLVWVKDRFGLGQYFRGQHELLLFGVMGKVPYKESDNPTRSRCVIPSVIHAKRRKHSQKPDEQYPIIEATSYSPYLELFARQRREGWDAWGDELDDTIQKKLI